MRNCFQEIKSEFNVRACFGVDKCAISGWSTGGLQDDCFDSYVRLMESL